MIMSACAKCQEPIPINSTEFITCVYCRSNYHFQCSGLPQAILNKKPRSSKDKWKCRDCRDTSSITSNDQADNSFHRASFTNNDAWLNYVGGLFDQHMSAIGKMNNSLKSILEEVKGLREDLKTVKEKGKTWDEILQNAKDYETVDKGTSMFEDKVNDPKLLDYENSESPRTSTDSRISGDSLTSRTIVPVIKRVSFNDSDYSSDHQIPLEGERDQVKNEGEKNKRRPISEALTANRKSS